MEENKKTDKLKLQKQIITVFLFKYFNLLMIVMVVTILFVGWSYVLNPKYKSISSLTAKAIAAKEEQKEVMNRYLNRLVKYKENYEAISLSERQKLDKILPQEIDKEVLYIKFEKLAQDLGLILTSIKIEKINLSQDDKKTRTKKTDTVKLPAGVGALKISADMVGADYDTYKRLLRALENNLRLMDVQKVAWAPSSQTAQLEIYTYYLLKNKEK